MGRPQRDQRSDSGREPQAGDRVSGIQPAHAVGDDVHTLHAKRFNLSRERRGTNRDAPGRRNDEDVHLASEALEELADAAKVISSDRAIRETPESEISVREHYR